jgi:hypothetical protein
MPLCDRAHVGIVEEIRHERDGEKRIRIGRPERTARRTPHDEQDGDRNERHRRYRFCE